MSAAAPAAWWRSRRWGIVGALSVTETVSWGILYYAFAVFLLPMQRELGFSTAQLTGAFSLALLVSAVTGVALVLAWSQVDGLAAFYALWTGLGLVMAVVLYEPAFTVLAKWFPAAEERRRALTALTLVAALASFIFLPLAQALIDAHGWRDALVILAVILGLMTVPLHALALRAPPSQPPQRDADRSVPAGLALRSASFWLLSAAFFLGTLTGIAMTVHAIPFLVERGHGAGFAAIAVGLVGISQIPGRVLFALLAARLRPDLALAAVFGLIAVGIGTIVGVEATLAVLLGLVLLGMGNGMATLARATAIADLYGPGAYGTIGAVAGAATTAARAAAPVIAAVYAAALGYLALLWTLAGLALLAALLAYRAENGRSHEQRYGLPYLRPGGSPMEPAGGGPENAPR